MQRTSYKRGEGRKGGLLKSHAAWRQCSAAGTSHGKGQAGVRSGTSAARARLRHGTAAATNMAMDNAAGRAAAATTGARAEQFPGQRAEGSCRQLDECRPPPPPPRQHTLLLAPPLAAAAARRRPPRPADARRRRCAPAAAAAPPLPPRPPRLLHLQKVKPRPHRAFQPRLLALRAQRLAYLRLGHRRHARRRLVVGVQLAH